MNAHFRSSASLRILEQHEHASVKHSPDNYPCRIYQFSLHTAGYKFFMSMLKVSFISGQ